MRRFFISIFTILLFIPLSTVSATGPIPFPDPVLFTKSFPDVRNDAPYFTAVEALKDWSVVSGFPDGTFKPENNVTRAEFLKMVFNSAGLVNPGLLLRLEYNPSFTFPDVDENVWYARYISTAYAAGFVQGNTDGNFYPNRSVSKAEAYKMVVNLFEINENSEVHFPYFPSDQGDIQSLILTDISSNDWVYPFFRKLFTRNLLQNAIPVVDPANYVQPNLPFHRSDLAELVFRAKVLMENTREDMFSYGLYQSPYKTYTQKGFNFEVPENWMVSTGDTGMQWNDQHEGMYQFIVHNDSDPETTTNAFKDVMGMNTILTCSVTTEETFGTNVYHYTFCEDPIGYIHTSFLTFSLDVDSFVTIEGVQNGLDIRNEMHQHILASIHFND